MEKTRTTALTRGADEAAALADAGRGVVIDRFLGIPVEGFGDPYAAVKSSVGDGGQHGRRGAAPAAPVPVQPVL
jgi:hypothetical protein